MTATLLFCLALVVLFVATRRSSGSEGRIEQRASKADLENAAKIAFRRHAQLHREIL